MDLAVGFALGNAGSAGIMAIGWLVGWGVLDDDAAGFVDPGSLGCGKGGMAEPGTGVLVCFPGLLLVSPVSLLMSPVLLLMSLTPVSLFSLSLLLLLLDVLDCLSVSFANTCT